MHYLNQINESYLISCKSFISLYPGYIMNQQVQRTNHTQSPPFYHPNHYYPQALHPSVSQNIVYQTMTYPIDVYHNLNYNHPNIRKPQTQSQIAPTQNEGFDPNRRLILDSFGRKASYYEYNVGQLNSSVQTKLVQSNQQKMQPLNYAQCNIQYTKSIKKPLYTSQIWTNQNNDINFSSKPKISDLKRISLQSSCIGDQNNHQQKHIDNKKNIIDSLYEGIQGKSHQTLTTSFSQLNNQQIHHQKISSIHQPLISNNPRMNPLKDSTVFLNIKPNLTYKLASRINIKLGHPCPNRPQVIYSSNCAPHCRPQPELQSPIFSSQGRKNQRQAQKKQNIQGSFQFKKKKTNDIISNSLHRSYIYSVKDFSLNDFELLDKIGKGSFGDVFLAQQKLTGFLCVIKKLSKKKLVQMKLQEHLFRQIKIQSFLKHRHLTSLYGFFHDDNYIYLILEIMSDGSLMQVKKKKKIPESQVSIYLKQICEGLKYMHTEQIIHRDIKPENIFMHEGYAKIGDFGCSIYTQSLRNTVVGSLAYISPQQLQQGFYDEKIDVWSLGVMAYEMLYGKSPYQQDIIKIARQQIGPNLSLLKFPPQIQISVDAKDFILSTLHLDSNHRIGIVQALKHPFIRKYEKKEQFVFDKCVI